ncbi:DUF2652 domain-containing protein [Olivibacter sp. SDN3]|uniref:DUF2652 domain-containing protein n=1 Tax=Olivibacter sp. SDN3 TaxID=2764720 RepID=UPI001651A268|nr:DUF2652 domain-containing protein [Olivibacter sp. SDN3]QNL48157.1 DUF2652 domain-containing protein [Olivibacter sp. SDN3]
MLNSNKGLIFIVDISGYSQFIREVNPIEGMTVVRHLLNGIIAENHLRLNISEIEGDAILFYQFGNPLALEAVLGQFTAMLHSFQKILSGYRSKFPKVDKLSLKAVAHYGKMEEFEIDRFRKLYGNTLVDAHRLLKNSVPSSTYVLVTTDYLQEVYKSPLDYSTTCGTYQCDLYDVGSLCYAYFPLDDYKFVNEENDHHLNVFSKSNVREKLPV